MSDPYAHIRQWGDPVLREKTRPVEAFDRAFAQQVSELAELMRAADGAGLAATQVGSLQRVFVYRLPDDEDDAPARVVVNPELVSASEERETMLEGCLSLGKDYKRSSLLSSTVTPRPGPVGAAPRPLALRGS